MTLFGALAPVCIFLFARSCHKVTRRGGVSMLDSESDSDPKPDAREVKPFAFGTLHTKLAPAGSGGLSSFFARLRGNGGNSIVMPAQPAAIAHEATPRPGPSPTPPPPARTASASAARPANRHRAVKPDPLTKCLAQFLLSIRFRSAAIFPCIRAQYDKFASLPRKNGKG